MPKIKKLDENSNSRFLVRFIDKDVIDLVQWALDENYFPNRNLLINEACRHYIKNLQDPTNETSMRRVIKEEIRSSIGILKTDLSHLFSTLEIVSIVQNTDSKLLARLFNYFVNVINQLMSGKNVLAISDAELESGEFDFLPNDLIALKNNMIKRTIDNK